MTAKKIMLIFGTRPEAIKMAPVVRAIESIGSELEPIVVVTAQHRELLDQVMDLLDIRSDVDLDLMTQNQGLAGFMAKALAELTDVIKDCKPDLVLVHGDTSTAFAGALAAYYNQVPVGHVEAGLRTEDIYSPWPEEANRRLVSAITRYHFAPTELSRANLLAEGVPDENIFVTGNTVVDSLLWVRDSLLSDEATVTGLQAKFDFLDGNAKSLVLVTNHRRENFGDGMESVFRAIARLAAAYPDTQFVFPTHLNPQARVPAQRILGGLKNVHLIEPVEYVEFVFLMERSTLIITDSGGIQEEAPSFGTPVLVTRDTTERPEALASGAIRLVGTDEELIVKFGAEVLDKMLDDESVRSESPFGDGTAADRIARIILNDPRSA